MSKAEFNAQVISREDLNPELFNLHIRPDAGTIPDFKAGQFAVLGLPGKAPRSSISQPDPKPADPEKFIQRAYSIASSPNQKNEIEFHIVLVKNGELTPRLHHLKEGDRVWLGPKISGHFVMDQVAEDQNIILGATGTGIAPFISMTRTHFKKGKRKWALLHGVRHPSDLAYQKELTELAASSDNFFYFPIISRPDGTNWTGQTGYVQNLFERKTIEQAWATPITPANTHVFLCGNPSMITTFTELLVKNGFGEDKKETPGQIHLEKYW